MKEENGEKFVILIECSDVREHMRLSTLEKIIHNFVFKLTHAQIQFVWINRGPPNLAFFEQIREIQKEYADINCKLRNVLQTDVSLLQTELLDFCKEAGFIIVGINADEENNKFDLIYARANSQARLHSVSVDVSGNVFLFNIWDRRRGPKLGKIGCDTFYQIIISMAIEETIMRIRERAREKEKKMIEEKRRRVTRIFQAWPPKIVTDEREKREITPLPLAYRNQSENSVFGGGGTSLFKGDLAYEKKQKKEIEFRSENKKKNRKGNMHTS